MKKGRHKDIKRPAQDNMVSRRKNRKESKTIRQRFAQKASQLLTQATTGCLDLRGLFKFFCSQMASQDPNSGNEEGQANNQKAIGIK